MYEISPRLDLYIAAILKNSEAVAIVSKQHYKDEIMRLREEVCSIYQTLWFYDSCIFVFRLNRFVKS